jgi:hypothetical protein
LPTMTSIIHASSFMVSTVDLTRMAFGVRLIRDTIERCCKATFDYFTLILM